VNSCGEILFETFPICGEPVGLAGRRGIPQFSKKNFTMLNLSDKNIAKKYSDGKRKKEREKKLGPNFFRLMRCTPRPAAVLHHPLPYSRRYGYVTDGMAV